MKSYCKGLRVDRELVAAAYEKWRSGDSGRKNEWRVYQEHGSPDALIDEIAREVRERRLSFRPIRMYDRRDSRKVRRIGQESVKQQVANYVAVEAMSDFLDARIGFYQVSSVAGKGSVFASRAVRSWVREDGLYWVHLDVHKCYQSLGHGEITEILNRYVRSSDVLYLCDVLLTTYERGLNIGSYFSLKMAQLALSFGYHEVESMHSVRRGRSKRLVTHQLWYADDVYLFSHDKRDLKVAVHHLQAYLKRLLGVGLNRWKVCVMGDQEPPDVAGYVCRRGRTTIRSSIYLHIRRTFLRFDRAPTDALARSVCSYWGWLKHSDSREATRQNGYDRIFRRARRRISRHERRERQIADNAVVDAACRRRHRARPVRAGDERVAPARHPTEAG